MTKLFIFSLILCVCCSTTIAANGAEQAQSSITPILTGLEDLPDLPVVKGPYPRRDDPNDMVGERILIGTTWYDYQANGNLSKMIAVDEDGGIHVVWTNNLDQDWGAGQRHTYYNYIEDDEPQHGDDGVAVDNMPRGGFTNIGYSPECGAVPIFHATGQDNLVDSYSGLDEALGQGDFTSIIMPQVGGNEYIWPHGTVDRNGNVHALSRFRNEVGDPTGLLYNRGVLTDDGWDHDDGVIIASIKGIAYTAAASRVSDKVALLANVPVYSQDEWARFSGTVLTPAGNNNLYVWESDDGEEFDWDDPINITNCMRPDPDADEDSPFRQGDTLRSHMFIDAIYDHDDNLHVLFNSVTVYEQLDPNANPGYDANKYNETRGMIWHWDRESGEINLVVDGRYNPNGNIGVYWRQTVMNPSIGIDEDGNLYCSFVKFPLDGDRGNNGYINTEVYATMSTDNGRSWAEPINLTDSHANNNNAGDGRSECWASLAEVVNNYLHITYTFDLDPGHIPRGEGVITENPVYYHRVQKEDIPSEPVIMGHDFHVGLVPEIAVDLDDEISVAAVPDGEPTTVEITVANPADDEGTLNLYVRPSVSEELAGVITFDKNLLRIPPGGEETLTIIFDPSEQGEYQGNILLETSIPDADPFEVPFYGLGAEGYGTLIGTVYNIDDENDVIDGATITLMPGNFQTVTDENGIYEFVEIPAFRYDLRCDAPDYLPFTDDLELQVNVETEFNIGLYYGTFEVSNERVEYRIGINDRFAIPFDATNNGNGTVTFTTAVEVFPDEEHFEQWEVRNNIDAESMLGDRALQGLVFAGDYAYIAGGYNNNADTNYVYVLNTEGELVRRFQQFAASRFGIRDLTFDGEYLWGGDQRTLYKFTTDGELVGTMQSPYNPTRGVAWDPERGVLWVCSDRTDLTALDMDGNVTQRIPHPDGTSRIAAVTYFPYDEDGYPLYLFVTLADVSDRRIYKCNPDDNSYMHVVDLAEPNGDAGGIDITSGWDSHNWTLLGILAGGSDLFVAWQLESRSDWITVIPSEGMIQPDETLDIDIVIDTRDFDEDEELDAVITFDHDGLGGEALVDVTTIVTSVGGFTRRDLSFRTGWNMVSLNIEPSEPGIRQLLAPLVDNGSLLLVKDGEGNFYFPARDIDNIEEWDFRKGYQFKMAGPDLLPVIGLGVAFDDDIALVRGWQMISYLPRVPVDTRLALSGIEDQLVIVKNGHGDFYVPAFNFSNIGNMQEGMGYLIKVTEDVTLNYRIAQDEIVVAMPRQLEHYSIQQSDRNMSLLLINVDQDIWEVAAVNNNNEVVGAGVRDDAGRVGMAVWGSSEDDKIRLNDHDRIKLIGWTGTQEIELNVEWIQGQPVYRTDELAVGRLSAGSGVPTEYALYNAYPNPFNSSTIIRYDLPQATNVSVDLFDASGRLVEKLYQGQQAAGRYKLIIGSDKLSSGIYFFRLQTTDFTQINKAVLVR